MVSSLRSLFTEEIKDQKVIILGHSDPDGDCVGSSLACYYVLKDLGYEVTVANKKEMPEKYLFLDPDREFKLIGELTHRDFEIAIILDSSDPGRLDIDLSREFPGIKKIINIDHHISNVLFGDINIIDPKAAATSEILTELMIKDNLLTPFVANSLYTGIATDTGSFKYESTTAETMRMAAILIENGANINEIRENVWENDSINRVKVSGKLISDLKISANGLISWMKLRHEDLLTYNLTDGDLETMIDLAKNIQGVEVAIFFKEMEENFVKISFRTRKWADANMLAKKFGGGGHVRAAGCRMYGDLDTIEKDVISVVQSFIMERE